MTKIIIVGQKSKNIKSKKKIELIKLLCYNETFDSAFNSPSDFKFIELVADNYGHSNHKIYDLIFAYDDPSNRSKGVFFLGRWNDGVV